MADTASVLNLLKDLIGMKLGERAAAFAYTKRATLEEIAHRNVARGGPLIMAMVDIATKEAEQRILLAHDTIIETLAKTTFDVKPESLVELFDAIDFDGNNADLSLSVTDGYKISGIAPDQTLIDSIKAVAERTRKKYRTQLQIVTLAPKREDVQISVQGNASMIQTGGQSQITQNHGVTSVEFAFEAQGVRREFLSRCKSLKKIVDNLDDPHAGVKWWRDQANAFLAKVQSLNIGRYLTDAQCDAIHEIEQNLHLAFDQARIEDEIQAEQEAAGISMDGSVRVFMVSKDDNWRTELRKNHFIATGKSIDDAIKLLEPPAGESA